MPFYNELFILIFYSVKRTNHELEQAEDGTEPDAEDLILENKVKIVTKAALAKKVIKKNIQANQKIMFDEEGQKVLDDTQKKSDLGQKYEMEEEDDEHSGINVAKVKEILKAEDKFDKELAKEKRKGKKYMTSSTIIFNSFVFVKKHNFSMK